MKRTAFALFTALVMAIFIPMTVQAGNHTLQLTPGSAPPNSQVEITGNGYLAGANVDILWYTMEGNRVSGSGFIPKSSLIAAVVADAQGRISTSFVTPYDLGGPAHRVEAVIGGSVVADTTFVLEREAWITPTSGPEGTVVAVRLVAGGWTQYDNNIAITYDNAFLGFACSFNSQGNITVWIQATGGVGTHVIGVYPALYYGPSDGPTPWKHPMLNTDDLPVPYETKEFVFEITEGGVGVSLDKATDLRSVFAPDGLAVPNLPAVIGDGSTPNLALGNGAKGIVGGEIPLALSGFPANSKVALRWNTVAGETQIEDDKNSGWVFAERKIELGDIMTSGLGIYVGTFGVPVDFGGDHMIEAVVAGQVLATGTWKLVPAFTAELSPDSSRIVIHAKGLGWEKYTAAWEVLYDNRLMGTITALTSSGSVDVSIPVVGGPGMHTIDIHEGSNGWPYLNMHESPWPWEPVYRFSFKMSAQPQSASSDMPLGVGSILIIAGAVIGMVVGGIWRRRQKDMAKVESGSSSTNRGRPE